MTTRQSNIFPAAEGDGTIYYPTNTGMEVATSKLGSRDFDGIDISNDLYALNELMSKPWTKRDYLHEMEASLGRNTDPHIAARVWAMAEASRYISSNPRDNFYERRGR